MDYDDQKIYTLLHICNANLWLNYICDATILRYNSYRPPKMPRNIHATSSMQFSINGGRKRTFWYPNAVRSSPTSNYWCSPEVKHFLGRFTEEVDRNMNKQIQYLAQMYWTWSLITGLYVENLQYVSGAPS